MTTAIDTSYDILEKLIAERVSALQGPLFTTDAGGLFDAYLAGIPEHLRQHYNCHCCRRFIERYGSLVRLNLGGDMHPVIFDGFRSGDWPGMFSQSAMNVTQRVLHARVIGAFINDAKVWGTPFNVAKDGRRWTHLHGTPSAKLRGATTMKTAEQAMTELKEDHHMLCRALAEYSQEAVVQTVRVLEADAVDRSEKTLGVAKWLLELHNKRNGKQRDNLIWLAVVTAPPGFCHIKSSMIGTLLDDVIAGLPFESIKRRWNEKMHPLQYRRPTSISDGNLERTNKVVEQLGSTGSLERRCARMEDILAFEWKPPVDVSKTFNCVKCGKEQQFDFEGFSIVDVAEARFTCKSCADSGVFDHLKSKPGKIKPVELPPKAIKWAEFRANVLPTARSVEVMISPMPQPFFCMVTAVNPEAPPILQWDGLSGQFTESHKFPDSDEIVPGPTQTLPLARNPVSWYFPQPMQHPAMWNVTPGWSKVAAICQLPCHWQQQKMPHFAQQLLFILPDAKDMRPGNCGNALFPETLRSEYHGIRHAVEAYSRKATLASKEEGNANGIALNDKDQLTVRVNGGDTFLLEM